MPDVLILIVMEVALGQVEREINTEDPLKGLNPYCNGGRTWTIVEGEVYSFYNVLILIVMEVALGLIIRLE